MGAMLEQGAGKRSALALSDEYEALGAEHSAWCDWDTCVATVKVLASQLGPALDLLSDVVLHPTFPQAEVERVRRRWLASFEQEKSSPPAIQQNALAAAVFGRGHPYGHSSRGAPSILATVTRAEIEGVWRRALGPRSTAVVVVGDVSAADARSLLSRHFSAWSAAGSPRVPVPHAPKVHLPAGAKGLPVVLVDVPGAAQSQVYLAHEGAPMATPDRVALNVMNAILGGLFSSRINLELRETRAYTYGAHSRFALRHGAGPFAAGGAIFAEHTTDAVRAILAQISRICDEEVSAEELADAKEHAKLALPARFEGVAQIAEALQELAVYGLPLEEFATLGARIESVTAADVQRVAKQWLHPDAIYVVVTGDRARIESELSAIGPIEVRDAFGDPVK